MKTKFKMKLNRNVYTKQIKEYWRDQPQHYNNWDMDLRRRIVIDLHGNMNSRELTNRKQLLYNAPIENSVFYIPKAKYISISVELR